MKRIVATVLCIVSCLMLFGCGEKRSESAENYMTQQLDKFKNATAEDIQEQLGIFGEDSFDGMDMTLFYKNLDYTIDTSTEKGDSASVDITVRNKDFAAIMQDYVTKLMEASSLIDDEEELTNESARLFNEIAGSDDYEIIETKLTVTLTKVDGEWKVDDTLTLFSSILPGIGNAFIAEDTY